MHERFSSLHGVTGGPAPGATFAGETRSDDLAMRAA
jgi:hypothetical protein